MVHYSIPTRPMCVLAEMALVGACSGSSKETQPGGVWVEPENGAAITGMLYFASQAYPSNDGDPPINYVDFTYSWEGRSGPWKVCTDTQPDPADTTYYECEVDLANSEEVVPPGDITVSFNVVDEQRNKTEAPEGIRTVRYQP